MKFVTVGLLWVFVACSVIAPLRSGAETLTDGTSPQLHAWFEYEYAREATYMSVSQPHRQQIVVITDAFVNRRLSVQDASARINALLTPPEKNAVLKVEQSFQAALQLIFPNAEDGQPSKSPAGGNDSSLDAGRFLLLLVYATSSATGQTGP